MPCFWTGQDASFEESQIPGGRVRREEPQKVQSFSGGIKVGGAGFGDIFFFFCVWPKAHPTFAGGCSLISTSIGGPQTHSLGRLFSRAVGPADGGPCAKMAAPSKVRTLCVPREKFQAALKGLWRHLWEMRRQQNGSGWQP